MHYFCKTLSGILRKMKRIITIALATLIAFAASAQDRLVDAVQKYSDRDYASARTMLRALVKDEPENDAAWYYLGLCDMMYQVSNSGGNEALASEGLSALKKAVALDSTNYWYRDRLAMAYSMRGESDLALYQYEQLAKDFPKKTEIQYSLVNLYLQAREYDKAVSTIDEIETVMGKTDGTVMTRFQILQQLGRNEEAYDALRSYADEYASPQVLSMLGDYEMGMFNDSTAIGYYDEALALDKDYAPARLGKAEVFRLTRKYDQYFNALKPLMADLDIEAAAKADYIQALMQNTDPRFLLGNQERIDTLVQSVLDTHPADSSALRTAGFWYFRTGRKDQAQAAFKADMDARPESITAAIGYIQYLNAAEDWAGLAQAGREAYARFPDEPGFIQYAASAEYSLKNYDAVIELSKDLLKAATDSASTLSALSSLGDMYHMTGNAKLAYKTYDQALKINPDYAPILNNYAYYLSEEGRKLKKAYKMSKITIEQEPDNPTYLDTFAWILHLMGKDLEAKPFFKHAMLYGGKESATILNHYAIVLEKLGENDLAKVYRSQAAALPEEE